MFSLVFQHVAFSLAIEYAFNTLLIRFPTAGKNKSGMPVAADTPIIDFS
jgi:hypothetical protein